MEQNTLHLVGQVLRITFFDHLLLLEEYWWESLGNADKKILIQPVITWDHQCNLITGPSLPMEVWNVSSSCIVILTLTSFVFFRDFIPLSTHWPVRLSASLESPEGSNYLSKVF